MAVVVKRHLVRNSTAERAACGLRVPKSWSLNPAEVTCQGCHRTLQMADAELRQRREFRNLNRKDKA